MGWRYYPPNSQTTIKKCIVEPSDCRDLESEASRAVFNHAKMRRKAHSCGEIVLENGVDIVDGCNDEVAAGETGAVVTEPSRKISNLPILIQF